METAHLICESLKDIEREILLILNEPGVRDEAIQRILVAIKTRIGVDAIGLRLQDGDNFPYLAQDGFSDEFLRTENTLVERDKDGCLCRDKSGNVRLECACGMVISGHAEPSSPSVTPKGTYWTNDLPALLALPTEQDGGRYPRNKCIHHGYASMVLVPIRTGDRIAGLLQLNDRRKDRFIVEEIEMLEGIAGYIGSALMRKQVERDYETLFREMLSGFALHEIVCDASGKPVDYRFLAINPAFERMTGLKAKDVLGHTVLEILPGTEQHWIEVYGKVAITGEPARFENESRELDKHFEVTAFRTAHKQFACIFADVTERKRAEREKEKLQTQLLQAHKMESVGKLAGGVAHDFNNMLSVILGRLEIALEQVDPAQPLFADLLEIQNAAERSSDLTRQLLAFARKQTIAPKIIDLNEVVGKTLNMLGRLIGEDIDVLWKPGDNLRPVKVDPSQFDQLLVNLCVNAKDAITNGGKITIETGSADFDEAYCALHPGFVPGEFVLLAVSDDGCGIDPKALAHVFEPFFTTKKTGKGTGLGLATVYGMVKQNNGFINVYSELGQGSTFKVYLPPHNGRAAAPPDDEPDQAVASGNETILLVEDEPAIIKLVTMMLERLGYIVVKAETPGEAIRLAYEHEGRVDLLMTDVVMPEMNGRDLATNLLSIYPELKRLFMSGYTSNVIVHHGALDEGVHFIQKPFSMHALAAKVREALE